MRSSVIAMSIVAVGLSMGARDATAARIVTADEGATDPNNPTTLVDSIAGSLCTANEDITACFATPYTVDSSFISLGFRATGGSAGINFRDEPVLSPNLPPCGPGLQGNGNLCSDQLYLTVSAPSPASGLYTLTWCWDSDLEPNVNICPAVSGTTTNLLEPLGFVDLTSFFTGTAGPLAAGQWQILARSDPTPEPASLFLLGSGLVAVGFLRLRKGRSVHVRRL
jgi:hypothetical protein